MGNTVNKRVLVLKTKLGLTDLEFCKRADISTFTLHKIKNDGEMRRRTYDQIIKSLNVNEEWLFFGTGEMFEGNKAELEVTANDPWRDALVSQLNSENTRLTQELNRVWAMVNHLTGGQIPSFHRANKEAGVPLYLLPGKGFDMPLFA